MNNKRRKGRRRRVNQHKTSMLAISFVILLLVGAVSYKGVALRAKEQTYLVQEAELEEQIDNEKAREEEIDELEAFIGTDEYIEQVAKEKLGLIKENEIILKAK